MMGFFWFFDCVPGSSDASELEAPPFENLIERWGFFGFGCVPGSSDASELEAPPFKPQLFKLGFFVL